VAWHFINHRYCDCAVSANYAAPLLSVAVIFLGAQAYYIHKMKVMARVIAEITGRCAAGDMESRILLPKERGDLANDDQPH
jgi:hypothetical protein